VKVLRAGQKRNVILSDRAVVMFPSEEERDRIKKDLTFDNPAYASTVRYSKWGNTNVPPNLFYYTERNDCIEVPIGYDLSKVLRSEFHDTRSLNEVKFPSFCLTLREDQEKAAKAYLNSSEGHHLIQLPTGKGKTVLSLYIASVLSQRTLILTHKDDLVRGWKEDADKCFDGKLSIGIIKAQKRSIGQVTIATIQTLNRMSETELKGLFDQFGFVVMDEAHHIAASSFSVFSRFTARYKLGVTATPERSDGLTQVMYLYCGSMIYKYENTGDDTDILPVKVIPRVVNSVYFDPVCRCSKYKGGIRASIEDLFAPKGKHLEDDQKRLSEIPYDFRPRVQYQTIDDFVVRSSEFIREVLKDLVKEFKEGHSCVLFFTQKEHIDLFYDFLVNVQHFPENCVGKYYGDNKDCASVLKTAKENRKFITLATYAKATEGTNCPQWEVAFLVSSINNGKNTEQCVGRIRRSFANKLNPVLVYDYRTPQVYSFYHHSATRDKRYKDLGFTIDNAVKERPKMFSRGFQSV
jgi:superfamily II DNA or RNA helicase